MLRHVITWRLAATDAMTKGRDAATISAALEGLVPLIAEIRSLTVAGNGVHIDGNWDLVLIIDFDDEAGLRVYGPHPEHQRVVDIIGPLVSERAAIDVLI